MFSKRNAITIVVILAVLSTASIVLSESKYNIKEMTPEVRMALDGRRARFDQLKQLKAQGLLGENKSGYVEALEADGAAKKIMKIENADRKVIYQAIAEQNGLTDALAAIEKVFAQVQRDKAESGERIQLEDGSWISKP